MRFLWKIMIIGHWSFVHRYKALNFFNYLHNNELLYVWCNLQFYSRYHISNVTQFLTLCACQLEFVMSRNAEFLEKDKIKTKLRFSITKRKKEMWIDWNIWKYVRCVKKGKKRMDIFLLIKFLMQTGFYSMNYEQYFRLQYYRLIRNVLWYYETTSQRFIRTWTVKAGTNALKTERNAHCTITGTQILSVSLLCGVCVVYIPFPLAREHEEWES